MYGEKNTTFRYPAFIALGFELGDTHADQSSGEATDCATDADSGESGHDGARSDQRTYAGNRERANTGQQAERTAQNSSSAGACGRAFRGLGGFFRADLLAAEVFGKKRRNIGSGKSRLNQEIGGVIRTGERGKNAEHCCLFILHGRSPFTFVL